MRFSIYLSASLFSISSCLAQPNPGRVCIDAPRTCVPTLSQALAQVRNNQTITLQPGRYEADVGVLRASGVTIKSADERNRAVLDAAGESAEGKAILVIRGDNAVIDGIEFVNAKVPSKNGAGIRLEAANLIVRNSKFDRNEMGILSGDHRYGHIQIFDSEFARSYRTDDPNIPAAGYPSHNIYIGRTEKLTLRGVWSHSLEGGHPIKSRARNNDIEASYFSTRNGTGSYEVEFPSGGNVRFVSNIVEQGVASENHTMLAFGLELARYGNPPPHSATIVRNTFVNHLLLTGTMLKISDGTDILAAGNIWVGPGKPEAKGNESLRALSLKDYANCDFRPTDEISVPNGKVGAVQFEYVHPAKHRRREDTRFGAIGPESNVFERCP
jgi:hypothetical protein